VSAVVAATAIEPGVKVKVPVKLDKFSSTTVSFGFPELNVRSVAPVAAFALTVKVITARLPSDVIGVLPVVSSQDRDTSPLA
jgi:hypothetical protein